MLLNELAEHSFNYAECRIIFVRAQAPCCRCAVVLPAESDSAAMRNLNAPMKCRHATGKHRDYLLSYWFPTACSRSAESMCATCWALWHLRRGSLRRALPAKAGALSVKQAVLEFRLAYPAEKWRNVYKALTVLEFLLTRGSDASVAIARDEVLPRLLDLAERFFYYADGRDHGLNVRHRCAAAGEGTRGTSGSSTFRAIARMSGQCVFIHRVVTPYC